MRKFINYELGKTWKVMVLYIYITFLEYSTKLAFSYRRKKNWKTL
jgi:hypothetical protein